jgi:hypothetical protein
VLVFPDAESALRPMVFNMSLRAVGSGKTRHWLVESWTPRGGGGGRSSAVNKSQGSPFDLGGTIAPAGPAATSLSSGWLILPIVLLICGALLVPLTVVGVERFRSRRAQRAYDAARLR